MLTKILAVLVLATALGAAPIAALAHDGHDHSKPKKTKSAKKKQSEIRHVVRGAA